MAQTLILALPDALFSAVCFLTGRWLGEVETARRLAARLAPMAADAYRRGFADGLTRQGEIRADPQDQP